MRTGDFKVRYDIEDQIKGVEVVYANENHPIYGVGMEKKELRVYAGNAESSETPTELSQHPQWYIFKSGEVGEATSPPTLLTEAFELEKELTRVQENGEVGRFLSVIPSSLVTYFTKDYPESEVGIYKFSRGGNPEKVLSGNYFGLEVTQDEKWLLTTRLERFGGGTPTRPSKLVRVNLKTKREYEVIVPKEIALLYPHCPSPSGDRILLSPLREGIANKSSETFWLDARTGKVQRTSGDLRPLLSKSFMPFQPASTPHSYWVAFFDELKGAGTFGLYNDQNFTFKPVFELPKMKISSTSIWADEGSGFIYLVHEGNLLRMPLK